MKFEIQTYFARNFADLGCFGSKFGANSCRYDSCNKALLWFYQNKCKQIANFTQLFTVSSCQFMTRSDDDGGKVSPSKGAAWLLRPQLMMNRASSWLGEISFSSQLAREPHKYQPEADLERTQFALTGIIWPDFRFFIHGLSVNWREGDGFEVLWREIYQIWECGQTVNLTQSYLMQQNQYEYEWINRESLCRPWFLWRMYLHSSDNRPQLMFVRDAVVYKQFIEDNMISPSNGIWICFRLSERGVGHYCFIGHLRSCQPILVSHALVRQFTMYISAQKNKPFTSEYVWGKTKISILQSLKYWMKSNKKV